MMSSSLPEVETELFVDGRTQGSDHTLSVVDPADGSSVVGYAAAASGKQAEAAVASAHRAFPAWSRCSAAERAELVLAATAPLEV